MPDRLTKILALLDKSPADAELLYAAALEHKKAGVLDQAIAFLDRTIAADVGYCYAYYQKGQTQEELGDSDAAAATYREGITQARRVGNAKAEGELSQALAIVE